MRARGARVDGLVYRLDDADLRALDRFEGHRFAHQRVVQLVLDEHGQRRRVTTYLQPEDGFAAWAPQPDDFRVLWRAYARLGLAVGDDRPLVRARQLGSVRQLTREAQPARGSVACTCLRRDRRLQFL